MPSLIQVADAKVYSNVYSNGGCLWDVVWESASTLLTCGGLSISEWHWDDGLSKTRRIFPKVHTKSIRRLALDSEHSKLIACGFDGVVSIYSLQIGDEDGDGNGDICCKLITKLNAHDSEIKGVSVSPIQERLLIASCGRDKSIWLHGEFTEMDASGDPKSPEPEFYCVSVLTNHTQDVKTVCFHPSKNVLVSTSYDKSTRVYGDGDGEWKQLQAFEDHSETVWDMAFSPDGTFFATCGADGFVYIYVNDLPKITARDVAAVPASSMMRAALKVASQPKRLQSTWRMDSYVCLEGHLLSQPIYSIDWCTQQSIEGVVDLIAAGCGDNSIRIMKRQRNRSGSANSWEVVSAELEAHEGDVNCVRWSKPTAPVDVPLTLASCGEDGVLKIWTFS